jgi:probable F420-dependent oxidoreductase
MPDLDDVRRDTARALGRVGVWSFALDRQPAAEERRFVAEIEGLGYPSLWIPEGLGSKDVLSHAAVILDATERLVVATGIASIYARDAVAMANGARMLGDAFPGRFVLGIGVSHGVTVEARGHRYDRPVAHMREYLDEMERAPHAQPDPERPAPVVLAALGPTMLRLSAERTAGAHTYFVPVEHTAQARSLLGPEPLLLPEQAAVLSTDADEARGIARKYMKGYVDLPNYRNNLVRLGWADEELEGGGSDRLVDAIVAWGGPEAIVDRVRAHLDAGADHVGLQLIRPKSAELPREELVELAPMLLALS